MHNLLYIQIIRGDYMSQYEYNKKYSKEWNKKNLKSFSVSLRLEEFELLNEYCKKNNISKAGLVKERLSDILNK